MKITLLIVLMCLCCSICFAALPNDKVAHWGVGYAINHQLEQHSDLSFLERLTVVALVAYVKEKSDPVFDKRDFGATMLGALTYQIKF